MKFCPYSLYFSSTSDKIGYRSFPQKCTGFVSFVSDRGRDSNTLLGDVKKSLSMLSTYCPTWIKFYIRGGSYCR
jgi:hypothetical protein